MRVWKVRREEHLLWHTACNPVLCLWYGNEAYRYPIRFLDVEHQILYKCDLI